MARDLWNLENSVREEYTDRRKEYPDEDPSDVAHEVADSNVPVYTAELLRLASEDIDLAVTEPECGPAFDGKPTPVNIIAANLYERLLQACYEAEETIKNASEA